MDLDAGARIAGGRFVIRKRLGEGAFGVVYHVTDSDRESSVALKTLTRAEPEALYRFKQEFRTLVDLSHPNLVTLYELMSEKDLWFFTMELIEGRNFVGHIRGLDSQTTQSRGSTAEMGLESADLAPVSPPLYADRLAPALLQLAEGVCALHRSGRLHRDIKPSNVLVTGTGRVVLLDFGLATELNRGRSDSVNIVGTPIYMSPEQGAELPLSEASDWYCVGVMLYEALTGRPPFTGKFIDVLVNKLNIESVAPGKLVSGIPEYLNELCVALLRREPSARPSGPDVLKILGARNSTSAVAPAGRLEQTPLVGRERHLQRLWEAFGRARAGETQTVCVHGSSGMGKSALLRHFLEEVRTTEPGTALLSGRCYERESVPYKAFDSVMDALSRYLKRLPPLEAEALMPLDAPALARLFPVLKQVDAVFVSQRAREIPDARELRRRSFAALREMMIRLTARRPVVLSIDDVQWGDVDSAALLMELLSPPEPPPLLLIASYRSDDVSSSPFLQSFLPMLISAGLFQETVVAELGLADAARLASVLLERGGSLSEGIARESGGNPFFINELVRHAQAGSGSQSGQAAGTTLEEVILARFSNLPLEAQRLLESVALAGRPLERSVAREAAGLGEEEQSAWTLLRTGHWIRTSRIADKVTMETYHDRIRETVVARLSVDSARALHRKLALALEAARADAEVLATHFLGAGLQEPAAKYAALAATQAAEALAFDRAARLYRLALDLPQPDPVRSRSMRVSLGDALANAGRGAEAAREYVTAAADIVPGSTQPLSPPPLELQRRASEQLLHSGYIDEGLAQLQSVLATLGMRLSKSHKSALFSFLLGRAFIRLRGLRYTPRDVSQVPAELLTRIDICWSAAASLGIVDTIRGADFQARHLLYALRSGEPYRIARAFALETAYSSVGGVKSRKQTEELSKMTCELADSIQHPHAVALSRLTAGMAAILQGRWKSAREFTLLSSDIMRERCTGVSWEICIAQFYSLLALYFQGDLKGISMHLPGLVREAQDRGDVWAVTNLQIRISFLVRLMEDQPAKALEALDQVMAGWSHQGFHIQHWWELIARVQILLYSGKPDEAVRFIHQGWPHLVRSFQLRNQYLRITSFQFRAAASLALAAKDPKSSSQRKIVKRDIANIERENTPWGNCFAQLLRAGVATLENRPQEALRCLLSAEKGFAAVDMALHSSVARYRRGMMLGSDEGKDLARSAEEWMRHQEIRNPAAWADMLAPACGFL